MLLNQSTIDWSAFALLLSRIGSLIQDFPVNHFVLAASHFILLILSIIHKFWRDSIKNIEYSNYFIETIMSWCLNSYIPFLQI